MATARTPDKRKPGRPAGDGANRDAILDSAKNLFSAQGFDGSSLRAIASDAHVDPALIRHFFSDKEGLFAAVVADRTSIPERLLAAFAGDRSGIGERLTRAYLQVWEDEDTGPIARALVRTTLSSGRSAHYLRDLMVSRVVDKIPDSQVDTSDAVTRLTLALSHLLGVVIVRHIAQIEPLATMPLETIVELVGPTVQRYATARLPATR
jgi:AcrR family transcriptional regulator